MKRLLVKGNEAVVIGALAAGCDAFFGYPITPASEIAHKAAECFPALGKIFIQAESEIAAINMVMGAAAAGRRTLTASSGPGISLKQEAISFMAGCELPCVIADIMRAGPGLGNIGPEQSDYNQIVKGGGHGDYHNIVLAPASVQEMYALTAHAFSLSDRYRNPAVVLADATLGQMMEPITLAPVEGTEPVDKPWRLDAAAASNENLLTSIFLDFDLMAERSDMLAAKYAQMTRDIPMSETLGDAAPKLLLTGYGIVSRLLRAVMAQLRKENLPVALVRPLTLWPFPREAFQAVDGNCPVLVVELSRAQFADDVRLALPGRRVEHLGCYGGNLPTVESIMVVARKLLKGSRT